MALGGLDCQACSCFLAQPMLQPAGTNPALPPPPSHHPPRLFRTTRATLTKHPDSMLAAMFRGDMQASALRDEQGHPFLDR